MVGSLLSSEELVDKFFKLGKHNGAVLVTLGVFRILLGFEERGRDLRFEMCFLGCIFFGSIGCCYVIWRRRRFTLLIKFQ